MTLLSKGLGRLFARNPHPPGGADAAEILAMLIDQARAQLDQQLEASDSHDIKSLGLLALNGAGVGIASVLARGWTWLLVIPILFAVCSGLAYVWNVRGRGYNFGPVVDDFYEKHGAEPLEGARRAMLAELVQALEYNNSLLPDKAKWFRRGTRLLLAEFLTGVGILFLQAVGLVR